MQARLGAVGFAVLSTVLLAGVGALHVGVAAAQPIGPRPAGAALGPLAETLAPLPEMEAMVCAALARQAGPQGVAEAVARTGWPLAAALETAACRFLFVDAGRRAPAGHHIAARWGNHALIPWLADHYAARGDPHGLARVFGRRGVDGDASDYLRAMIARFDAPDPEMAALFRKALNALEAALARASASIGEGAR